MTKHKVVELFGVHTSSSADWHAIVASQHCPYSNSRCFKVRKSDSAVSIGTCTVRVGEAEEPLIICPKRLLQNHQVFADCLHLLGRHKPGNELHLVPEVTIPGGSVDFFLVSVEKGRPVDFVGIEFQTLDTTGTVWPARQDFLSSVGVADALLGSDAKKPYGMNWKMTAKTILMQLHHKATTFEALGRNLVLVIQDPFMRYMQGEFDFGHLTSPAVVAEPVHFHSYEAIESDFALNLSLLNRQSTDVDGIAKALNLGFEARVDEVIMLEALKRKISSATRWSPF